MGWIDTSYVNLREIMFILYTHLQFARGIARGIARDFHDQNEIHLDVVAAGLHYHIRSRTPIPRAQLDETGGMSK